MGNIFLIKAPQKVSLRPKLARMENGRGSYVYCLKTAIVVGDGSTQNILWPSHRLITFQSRFCH